MTKKDWREEFDKRLDEWLDSNEHTFACASHDEGLYCCLDDCSKETTASYGGKGRDWVKAFIEQVEAEARQDERTRVMDELLQRFNDYEVPLSVTAKEARDIITEYLSNQ